MHNKSMTMMMMIRVGPVQQVMFPVQQISPL